MLDASVLDAPRARPHLSEEVAGAGAPARHQRWAVGLLLITCVAAALRVYGISTHSFWYDEAVSAALAERPVGALFSGAARDNGNPPLYWILAHFWVRGFGNSEVAMRLLSAAFGVAAVAVMGLLGRRLFRPSVGLLAAGLLAVSPLAIELGNEARAYALQGFIIILSTWLFVRWTERRGWLGLAAYAVTVALACYTHYYSFFLPLAHGLSLLASREYRKLLLPWVAAMVFAAALWSPWLLTFRDQLATPGNLKRMASRWPVQFIATPVTFSVGRTFAWRDASRAMLLVALAGSVLAFWVPAGLAAIRGRPRFTGALLLAWLGLPIIIPFAAALAGTPLYHTRAASVAMPAFLLLIAGGLVQLRPSALRGAAVTVILGMTAFSLVRYGTEPLKDDWRSAAKLVTHRMDAGELFVFDTDIEVTSFLYYAKRLGNIPKDMVGLTGGADRQGQLLGIRHSGGRRVDQNERPQGDFVFSASGLWVFCAYPSPPEEHKTLLEGRGFQLIEEHRFYRIAVMRFRKSLVDAGGE